MQNLTKILTQTVAQIMRRAPTFCMALAMSAPAFAQAPADAAQPPADRLKQAALDLYVDIDRLEEDLRCPAAQRLRIYIDTRIERLAIVDVYLRLDEQQSRHKVFEPAEAVSLERGGLYRFSCVNTEPGTHRLRAELRVREAAAPTDTPPAILVFDETFEQAPQTTDIELSVDRANFVSAPLLQLSVWQPLPAAAPSASGLGVLLDLFAAKPASNQFRRGGSDDPQLRNARFLAGSGRRFGALTRLLRLPGDAADQALAADFYRELGSEEVDFGTLYAAANTYRRARAAGSGRAAKARLVPLRVALALAFYRRGDYAQAERELAETKPDTDKLTLIGWQDAQSRVLLAQGRYDAASELLLHTAMGADYESYLRYYNLGSALVASGHADQGATVLDRVGKLYTSSPLLLALRDQANLALGWHFLREQQGATAIPVLSRIAVDGPHANRALLGLGWAWLAPPGKKQKKIAIGDERTVGPPPEAVIGGLPSISDHNLYQRYGLRPFQRAHISKDEDARLKRALVAWVEFKGRDTTDPAVQEGLLAIALALEQLGAHEAARDYYERGVGALDATGHDLEAVLSFASAERWMDVLLNDPADAEPGGDWALQNLPNPRAAVFLHDVVAGDAFQQALKDYRDLRLLERSLQTASERLASLADTEPSSSASAAALGARSTALLADVAAAEPQARARVRSITLEDLEAQQRQNRKLSEAGHFSLARVYDRISAGH